VHIAFFQSEQWDSIIAVCARQLLLDIVKKYARADDSKSPSDVSATSSRSSSSIPQTMTVFGMAMALKAAPAVQPVVTAADGKDKVDLYCGNISPVTQDFDDPLKWWKVIFYRFFLYFALLTCPKWKTQGL
jgi:hypothetical protein